MSVIVAKGRQSTKIVDGQEREVVPFTGADREGELASFGVGFYFTDKSGGSIWGALMPRLLINSWRAMKLLEHLPQIGHGTLCACWHAAGESVHDSNRHYLDELARQFDSPEVFEATRSVVLASVPTAEELDRMLATVRDNSIDVSVHELTKLIEQGKLPHNPIVDELVREDEERQREHREHQTFVEAPMPSTESLSVLFEDLGITNMLDGVPFGGYGLDWGHIELSQLDSYVKEFSTGKFSEGCWFKLKCTTDEPRTQSAQIAKGITAFQTSFGEIEEPWCIASNGTKYTFLEAAYRDGSIVVKTHVEEKGKEPEVGTYSVQMLRDMLGPIAPKPKKKRWRFSRR